MNCVVCHRPFQPHGWRKHTCGDPICVRQHELHRQRLYARRYYGYKGRAYSARSIRLEALKLRLRVLGEYEANAQIST